MILECRGDIMSEWGATSPGISTATSAELAARDYCEKHDVREAMRNEGVVL